MCSPDVVGKDVVELGCGTAYFSAWLARRGARPVGVDLTPAQLETARRLQEETGSSSRCSRRTRRRFRCRTRRSTWPSRSTAPRSGATPTAGSRRRHGCSGRAASSSSCGTRRSPCSVRRSRPARDAAAAAARAQPDRLAGRRETEFHLPLGELYALLREAGFDVLDIKELYAPVDAEKAEYYHSDHGVGEALALGGDLEGAEAMSSHASIRSCSRRRALSAA